MPMGMSSFGMGVPQMRMDQGKGKARDMDFDAAFAQVTASLANQTSSARITEVDGDAVSELADNLQEARLDKGKEKAGESDFQR